MLKRFFTWAPSIACHEFALEPRQTYILNMKIVIKPTVAKLDLKKLLDRVELKSKFNFESFLGFAIKDAEAGTMGEVAYQLNVNDTLEPELKNIVIQGILDNYVYPAIMHRVYEGTLSSSYKPTLVHMLLNSDPSKNKILLGRETHFSANYVLKNDRDVEKGERIEFEEIKEITKIFPCDNYMANSAHIMLVKFKSKWLGCIDLVFDRLKVRSKMRSASDFLDSARDDLENNRWSPFVTNIWRATELAALSLLLFTYQGDFSTHQDHEQTKNRFKAICKGNNVPSKFADHYDNMYQSYKHASYVQGIKGDFTLTKPRAQKLVVITDEIIAYVNKTLERVDQNRKPSGEKIIVFKA